MFLKFVKKNVFKVPFIKISVSLQNKLDAIFVKLLSKYLGNLFFEKKPKNQLVPFTNKLQQVNINIRLPNLVQNC